MAPDGDWFAPRKGVKRERAPAEGSRPVRFVEEPDIAERTTEDCVVVEKGLYSRIGMTTSHVTHL